MSAQIDRPPKRTPRFTRQTADARKQQLIAAAIDCLAEGGMAAFTIDRICRKAGISRGLISHHFKGKEALLAAAYEVMTRNLDEMASAGLASARADPAAALRATIEANFAEAPFDKNQLKAWLAVWGEVANNVRLKEVHRKRYIAYQSSLAAAIAGLATQRRRKVDAEQLATMFIALIDGLWLEWCLDAGMLSRDDAKAACYALLEPYLGPLQG
ncbi:MAG: transcriptional regulator BetI [Aestuariivirgaceae bacterium]